MVVDHECLYELAINRIERHLSGHDCIDVSRTPAVRVIFDEDVHVREAAFLELNSIDVGCTLPEDAVVVYFLDDQLFLHLEDARNQLRSIVRCLAAKECTRNFWPLRICSDSDEKVHLD